MGGIRPVVYLKREPLAAGVETDYSRVAAASSDYKPEVTSDLPPRPGTFSDFSVSSTNMCNALASSQVLTEIWDLLDVFCLSDTVQRCAKSFGRVGEQLAKREQRRAWTDSEISPRCDSLARFGAILHACGRHQDCRPTCWTA